MSMAMYGTHTQAINGNQTIASTSHANSETNASEMQFTQLSRTQAQHSVSNLAFMDLEFKPSACMVSEADGTTRGTDKVPTNSFNGPSGLTRYHSAPSAFLSNLAEEENNRIISQYFSNDSSTALETDIKPIQQNQSTALNYHQSGEELSKLSGEQNKYVLRNAPSLKRSGGSISRDDMLRYPPLNAILENVPDVAQESYAGPSIPLISQAQVSRSRGQSMESFRLNSVCSNNLDQEPNASSGYSTASKLSIIRHSSSPAGFLSELVAETHGAFESGYAEGSVRNSMSMGSSCPDVELPNKIPSRMNCVRQNSSPSGLLNQVRRDIHASDNQSASCSDDGGLHRGNARQGYIANFSVEPWEDRAMSVNYANMPNGTVFSRKRPKEYDEKMRQDSYHSDLQKEGTNRGYSGLPGHATNLPRTFSAELAMEELLQDAVPCKVRAKRGCATHPRSIAERVRRTRISERMRKLQELVPNSDKQTVNIADMLDEAVEYVKSLQRQVQELSEKRDRCTCVHSSDCAYKT